MESTHELRLALDHPTSFDVRHFVVTEALHELFAVELEVRSPDIAVDLGALMGVAGRFELQRTGAMAGRGWSGIVTEAEHLGVEEDQLQTYRLLLRPALWLATQRRTYRVFQQLSDPAIALAMLAEWGVEAQIDYDPAAYPARKYRVQYAESDYDFLSRLLEDAGITMFFEDVEGTTRLVLRDAPQAAALREPALPYEQAPSGELLREVVTDVRVTRRIRPGRYTQRDVDYRRSPDFPLVASEGGGSGIEGRLERYHLNYGAFLFSAESDGQTPIADDRGAARTNLAVAARQVERRLAAKRSDAWRCSFKTTVHELGPGDVVHLAGHPRADLAEEVRLLVAGGRLSGSALGDWDHELETAFAAQAYHPPLATPKPKTLGIESATVVGPAGDEIHTDELGRVRVQFHWDREGTRDGGSSCWIPVNQPWGGTSFGAVNLPRVGQEVLIDFLGEDPDRPVIVGRVFTTTNPAPYALPKHKTVSGIRSQSANQHLLQQILKAGLGAATQALQNALADALSDTFGQAAAPLALTLPKMAAMLAKLPVANQQNDGDPNAPPTPPMPPPIPTGPSGLPLAPVAELVAMAATPPMPPEVPVPGGLGPVPSMPSVPAMPQTPGLPVDPGAPGGLPSGPNAPSLPVMEGRPPLPAEPSIPSGPGPAPSPPAVPATPATPAMPADPMAPSLPSPPAPGALPEMPMGPGRLQDALDTSFPAFSPGDEGHRWVGSEVTMDDTLGAERLYMQAQRDMNTVVKNTGTCVVGGAASSKIGTCDVLDVGHQQCTTVLGMRVISVGGHQVHMVSGDIHQSSKTASQSFVSALEYCTRSKKLELKATDLLTGVVGGEEGGGT
ncbi:MAG: type VI secretion system tip protein VgrG, partial [Myxococcales bacterium]|nr:type VI secretion system tip protein VgrG [Myxococcales bacterium]